MIFVKICGTTRREDAEAAVNGGAAAIGFVFWPASPRAVDPATAAAIARTLPPDVERVGVFVNQGADEINAIADVVGLSAIQLHGDEGPGFAASLARPVIKAISVDEEGAADREWPADVMMLVDAHDPVRRGGTGRSADWAIAAALARRRRVLLAGGLTPENVAGAISAVRPYGIDVSSGVESSPGIKDHARLDALFRAVGRAEAERSGGASE